jgi:hypothetical protein
MFSQWVLGLGCLFVVPGWRESGKKFRVGCGKKFRVASDEGGVAREVGGLE